MKVNEWIKLWIDRWYISWNSLKFAYINWINLVNQIALNKTTQTLKWEFWDNYKDYLTDFEIKRLNQAERVIYNFVSTWINLKQIKFIYLKSKKLWLSII